MRAPKARRTVFAAVDRKTAGELARWVRNPGGMRFAAVADTCYAWYAAQADAVRTLSEALPVIYSGVAMGQLFKGSLRPDPALAFSILALTWLSLQNVGWKRPVESRFAAGLLLPGHFFRPHRCRWRMKAAGAGCLPAKPTFFW